LQKVKAMRMHVSIEELLSSSLLKMIVVSSEAVANDGKTVDNAYETKGQLCIVPLIGD
jgi:hypothetical protein